MSAAAATTTSMTTMEPLYQDGDVIKVKWHIGFVFLAYFVSFLGSYSAIRVLERGLWRSEQEARNATCKSIAPFTGFI
jgi:hypothetical protein